MHGLEPVADIGESAADDDRHRVVEIRPAHLVFDIGGDNARGARRVALAITAVAAEGKLGILIVCHKMFGPSHKLWAAFPYFASRTETFRNLWFDLNL